MKAILALLALVYAAVAIAPAEARTLRGRFCLLQANEAGPGDCRYATYAQCAASASGRAASCVQSPANNAYGQYLR
jgi:hypothetical protein